MPTTAKSPVILPAEWAKQQFVQLTYPHAQTDWAPMLEEVSACFDNIIGEIARRQNVLVVTDKSLAAKHFPDNVLTAELPSNDTWARDHGGITVFRNGKSFVLDFCFNGWGLKFPAEKDNQLTGKLFQKGILGHSAYENHLDFVLEGGSIESDGEGVILTTEKCLLSKNRNALSKQEIERKFKLFFGTKKILWLRHGYLAGDDTDSHIDTLARFCNCSTIAYIKCDDPKDEHYAELQAMEAELEQFKTAENKTYRLTALPMADAVYDENGERLPATYANFLIINGAVLMPAYGSPKDKTAKRQLQTAFPDREIIAVNCLPLIKQHGSLHCVTMQYPEYQQ
jgi:agmatine/peptidylarginine deiminase